ncbi:MAG TPA: hypothetical protein VK645_20620 [Chitinophagaceae bacterium]|nr:hypothetical protein [Chitinophagaceae bacterium]
MNKNPKKEKIVNREVEHGIAQIDTAISAAQNEKDKEKGKKQKLTMADLKGKKVDADPELESDQPIDQVY